MKCLIHILLILIGFNGFSCNSLKNQDTVKKIYYVNSYHNGYGSSDAVMEGIKETLQLENVELKIFFLDAKQKNPESEILESVSIALSEISEFEPDLLLVSDDNAIKDLVVPHFNNTNLPVVFCGVNWSAEQYNLGENITGMLEVLPLHELLSEVMVSYPEARNLVVLSENSLSEQNNKTLLDTLFRNLGLSVTYNLTNDFESWKQFFINANETADIIYLPTNGAINNWDEKEAKIFVEQNLKIPVVTCDDFMMPYAVFGLTKVAREQGEWIAEKALEILSGKNPIEIPIAKNEKFNAWLNKKLANKIHFNLRDEIINSCNKL